MKVLVCGGRDFTDQAYTFHSPTMHHTCCDWHLDQYPWECTCGLTAPKAPWFDEQVREYTERQVAVAQPI